MKYLWILLLPLLVSCGRNSNHSSQPGGDHIPVTVDPALSQYMLSFERDIGPNTSGITAQFATLATPIVGQCISYSNGDRVVQVDPVYWATAVLDMREQLMYHELGHAFGRVHDPNVISLNGQLCPESIMYPTASMR